ncbi:SGNH/GDSL hydrolase family protein [Microbacter sp. GSS18]|nr:SGNH/GDSL hydrolase family protein [Microbacter sp. GSS18]
MPTIETDGSSIGRGEVIAFDHGSARLRGHLDTVRRDDAIRPIRLPTRLWDRFPPAMANLRGQFIRPSGVRLSFLTPATSIELRVRCTRMRLPQVDAERNGFSLCIDGDEHGFVPSPIDAHEIMHADDTASHEQVEREWSVVRFSGLPGRDKLVEIWLPQMMTVDIFDVRADAPFTAPPISDRPVWVHYGSSISHGGNADRPIQTVPASAARAADLQLVNLGVAGQCHIDPFVASAIAGIRPDIVSLELGVNVVGARSMDRRTFAPAVHGFLDTLRAAHPRVPIVVISPLLWTGNETQSGPGDVAIGDDGAVTFFLRGTEEDVQAGALSMRVAREQLREIVEARRSRGEPTALLDGLELYGPADATTDPLSDSLHPNGDQSERIGRRLARRLTHVLAAAAER